MNQRSAVAIGVILLVAAGWILTNLLATRSHDLVGRSGEKPISLHYTYRNAALHPLRTATIVEIRDAATPGIRRWIELSGVTRDQAASELISAVSAEEVVLTFRSRQVMTIRF